MTTPGRSFYPVIGRSDTGIVAPRLPIEVLQTKDEQFALFVLSYLIIQDRRGSLAPTPLPIPPGTGVAGGTFFNIAGIHGKPYIRWPGDDKEYPSDYDNNKDPNRFGGYCNHGSVLFPTWHRPYVLVLEQSIGEQATALAKEFDKLEGNNSTKWQDAAKELRFPYWDWAAPNVATEGLPPVLYEEKIPIRVPKSAQKIMIDNPMAFFPIAAIPSDFTNEGGGAVTSYLAEWKTTLRHPKSARTTKSDINELQAEIKANARDLRSKVAALFTFGPNMDPNRAWDEFSNHSPVTIRRGAPYHGSIEGVHDSIHGIMGGLGHMSYPDYAGFDPFFFLHHCNVDRLIALWEYSYRNENNNVGYWMGNGYKEGAQIVPWTQPWGTYNEISDAQLLPSSALAPFRLANGEYWSSEEARYLDDKSFKKFYTYETAGVKVDAPATAAERISARQKLQAFYSYTPVAKQHPGGLFRSVATPEDTPGVAAVVEGHRQFTVVVELLEHAANGPYVFKLFKKPANEGEAPELIGAVTVFARPASSPCAGCAGRRAQGTTITGVIFFDESIVEDLIKDSTVDTNNLEEVAAALKSVLYAEVQNTGGVQLSVMVPSGSVAGVAAAEITPVAIELLSSAAVRKHGGPVHWTDWSEHGDPFADFDWAKPQA